MSRAFFILLLFSSSVIAQDFSEDQDSTLIYVPNTICLDNNIPFIRSIGMKDSFELYFYNRWGEIIAQTNDPNFELGKILGDEQRRRIRYMEDIFYRLSIKRNGVKESYNGSLVYIEYCNCG